MWSPVESGYRSLRSDLMEIRSKRRQLHTGTLLLAMCLCLTPAMGAPHGPLGVVTSESELRLELPRLTAQENQPLYLLASFTDVKTDSRFAPRIKLLLATGIRPGTGDHPEAEVLGIVSIFPWPRADQAPIRASFNLTRALARLNRRLGYRTEEVPAQLSLAVRIIPDPRDPGPASASVSGITVSAGPPP